MSALSIQVPFPVFQGRDGQPLENGYVWIGVANLNPQTNPVVAYYDSALTIPAAQPLRTLNGYVSRAGTPAQIYVDGVNFSILVQDSKGSMVYNFPDGTGISPDACGVTYDPPFTGGVPYPVCEKLDQYVSVKDFGAVGNGVADDTAAIQAAIDAVTSGQGILFPAGNYAISSQLNISNKDSIALFGDGGSTGTSISWIGAAAPLDSILYVFRSAYCTIYGLRLTTPGLNQPGYGVRITSGGAGVTQGTTVENCRIENVSEFGIYIGRTDNTDQSVDLTSITNCWIDNCGEGSISIHGANINMTKIVRGSYGVGNTCGIEVGAATRSVTISECLPYDAAPANSAAAWLYIRNNMRDVVEVSNMSTEMFRRKFIATEASTVGNIGFAQVVVRNCSIVAFYHTVGSAEDRLIEYTQHGSLVLENCWIQGRGDIPTYVWYQTPDIAGAGLCLFETKNILLTPTNMELTCQSLFNTVESSQTAWTGNYRLGADPFSASFKQQKISINSTPAFLAFLTATQNNVTGDGTLYDVIFNSQVRDYCDNYNPTTGEFTARFEGLYQFNVNVQLINVDSVIKTFTIFLVTSNRTYQVTQDIDSVVNGGSMSLTASFMADMQFPDTAFIRIAAGTNVNPKTVDVYGDPGTVNAIGTFFSGHLVV
jgi:hypothetical protein